MTGAVTGCAKCYGDDPDATWKYYLQGLSRYADLIDESHFMVNLRRCTACAQSYVWVFMESVNWVGGHDPQYRRILPVSEEEAADLAAQGEQVDTRQLGALGWGRRHLGTDWPSGEPQTVYWTMSGFIAADP